MTSDRRAPLAPSVVPGPVRSADDGGRDQHRAPALDRRREGPADRRRHAHVGRRARRGRSHLRPRRPRGRRLARAAALLLRHEGAAAGRGRPPRLRRPDGDARRAACRRGRRRRLPRAAAGAARGRRADRAGPRHRHLRALRAVAPQRGDRGPSSPSSCAARAGRSRRCSPPSRPRACCSCGRTPRRSPTSSSASPTGWRCGCSASPIATAAPTIEAGVIAVRSLRRTGLTPRAPVAATERRDGAAAPTLRRAMAGLMNGAIVCVQGVERVPMQPVRPSRRRLAGLIAVSAALSRSRPSGSVGIRRGVLRQDAALRHHDRAGRHDQVRRHR